MRRIVFALALLCLAAGPAMAGAPERLALAIEHVESGGNPNVVGRHGEIGLMQIKLATARSVGYRGTKHGLFDRATNRRVGRAYLARAWARAGGDLCKTASLFNLGIFARPRCTAYGRTVLRAMRR